MHGHWGRCGRLAGRRFLLEVERPPMVGRRSASLHLGLAVLAASLGLLIAANDARADGVSYLPYNSDGTFFEPGQGAQGPAHSTYYFNSIMAKADSAAIGLEERKVGTTRDIYNITGTGIIRTHHHKMRSYPYCYNDDSRRRRIVQCHAAWSEKRGPGLFGGETCAGTLYTFADFTEAAQTLPNAAMVVSIIPSGGSIVFPPPDPVGMLLGLPDEYKDTLTGRPSLDAAAMVSESYGPSYCGVATASELGFYGPSSGSASSLGVILQDGTGCLSVLYVDASVIGCGGSHRDAPAGTYAIALTDYAGNTDVFGIAPPGSMPTVAGEEPTTHGNMFVFENVSDATARSLVKAEYLGLGADAGDE